MTPRTTTMGRRAHGTGSIWTERRRAGDVWMGQVRVEGKQRQRTLGRVRSRGASDGLTRAMAERALREFRDEAEAQAAADARAPADAAKLRSIATEHLRHLESNDTKAST